MQRLNDHFPALCRLYAGGDALMSWYSAISNPHSNLFRVGQSKDGSILLWMMGIVGAAIVLDVILNDWTPNVVKIGRLTYRVSWKRAFQQRHWLFVALAYCYGAQCYAGQGSYELPLLVFFYWNSFQNLVLAFFDARQRSRSLGWQRVLN